PAEFDRHVATFTVAGFVQAFVECCRDARFGPAKTDNPDHRQRRLLRPRRQRPRRCRAADESYERATFHSITSSARPMRGSGNVTPSVFAVFRLTTNSTFVDCTTGRSAGFAPLRMRPT